MSSLVQIGRDTKVNRCITEGRKRFMRLYEELESGVECERLAPTLHALAQGTADSEALLELRPHLRTCAGCRATVRALHASHLRTLTAFAAAVIAPARAFVERLRGGGAPEAPKAGDLHPVEHQEKVDELFRRINAGEAAVQPVAPSVAEGVGRLSTVRPSLRGWVETALQRLQSSDLAISVHAASSGGGGRISSIAALIGICVSGVGAGTYCVATALLPDPKPAIRSESKAAKRAPVRSGRAAEATNAARHRQASLAVVPHADPTSTPEHARRPPTRPKGRTPTTPDEFSFEASSTTAAQARARSTDTSTPTSRSTSRTSGAFETDGASQTPAAQGEFSDGTGGEFSP